MGAATLSIEASAGKLVSKEELDVPFGVAKPKNRVVQRVELQEGDTDLKPLVGEWLATTEKTEVWVTSNPYVDVFNHLTHLVVILMAVLNKPPLPTAFIGHGRLCAR